MIANICHYGAWHKPADCYYHEENNSEYTSLRIIAENDDTL